MKDVTRTAPVRQGYDDEFVDAITQKCPELANPLVIGAISPSNSECALVNPNHVTPFDLTISGNSTDYRNFHVAVGGFLSGRLRPACSLAHVAENDASAAGNGGITRVDRIQSDAVIKRQEMNVNVRVPEDLDEPVIFVDRLCKSGRAL